MDLTNKKSREYFLSLSERIFLTPKDFVLEDCLFFVSGIDSHLDLLKKINTSNVDIYYGRKEIFLTSKQLNENKVEFISSDLLKSFLDSCEFTNIKAGD